MKSSTITAVVGLLACIALPAACGSEGDTRIPGGGGTAASSTGGGSAMGGASASGGIGTGGGSGGLIIDSGTGGSLTDASCASTSETADLVPLDLYIMLDKSGSMQTSGGWDPVVKALEAFVNDAASVELGVGLQFFPGSPECMTTTYSTPAVPMGTLPGNAVPVTATLAAATPGGQTPTLPALQGAVEYMTTWLLDNPTHTGVVVLATDGVPNNCASTIDKVAAIAQQAAGENPKILTFVIGVGSELTALDQIAQAGGTKSAFLVDTAGDVTKQFIEALNAIRGGVVGCEYLIPQPEAGTIDIGKVNVEYKPGDGSDAQTIPNVPGPGACTPGKDGWYYDNVGAPTKVILCPDTCTKIQADGKAEIGVVFGCTTIIA